MAVTLLLNSSPSSSPRAPFLPRKRFAFSAGAAELHSADDIGNDRIGAPTFERAVFDMNTTVPAATVVPNNGGLPRQHVLSEPDLRHPRLVNSQILQHSLEPLLHVNNAPIPSIAHGVPSARGDAGHFGEARHGQLPSLSALCSVSGHLRQQQIPFLSPLHSRNTSSLGFSFKSEDRPVHSHSSFERQHAQNVRPSAVFPELSTLPLQARAAIDERRSSGAQASYGPVVASRSDISSSSAIGDRGNAFGGTASASLSTSSVETGKLQDSDMIISSGNTCYVCGKAFRTKQGYLRHNQTVQ
jgi:hypothetical protein